MYPFSLRVCVFAVGVSCVEGFRLNSSGATCKVLNAMQCARPAPVQFDSANKGGNCNVQRGVNLDGTLSYMPRDELMTVAQCMNICHMKLGEVFDASGTSYIASCCEYQTSAVGGGFCVLVGCENMSEEWPDLKAKPSGEYIETAHVGSIIPARDIFYDCGEPTAAPTAAATPQPTAAAPAPTTAPPTTAPPTTAVAAAPPTTAPPTAAARVSGDPHARNLRGQRFQIYQTGNVPLFLIPRTAASEHIALLHVAAIIDRVSPSDCHSSYMRRIIVNSRLSPLAFAFDVGDIKNTTSPFTLQIGEDSPIVHSDGFANSVTNEVKVSSFIGPYVRDVSGEVPSLPASPQKFRSFSISIRGSQLHIQRIVKPALNLHYLNIEARGLASLGTDVGGLLGYDDHRGQLKFLHDCERSAREQFTSIVGEDGSF